jgi:hypothetical protein
MSREQKADADSDKVITAIPAEPRQTEFRLVAPRPEPEEPAPTQPNPTQPNPMQPSRTAANQVVPRQGMPGQGAWEASEDEGPLLAGTDELRAGWQRIKAGFVDNPPGAVAEASGLVDDLIDTLIGTLRARQQRVRDTWDGDGPSRDTEALRVALLRYQALFNRIARRLGPSHPR